MVGIWLLGCSAALIGVATAAGLTRRFSSGMSTVTWHPHGMIPFSDARWRREFEAFKANPKFFGADVQLESLTLKRFKFLYVSEWIHRHAGSVVGALFFGPMAYFW